MKGLDHSYYFEGASYLKAIWSKSLDNGNFFLHNILHLWCGRYNVVHDGLNIVCVTIKEI